MIPQSLKDIISSGENTGFYQTLALVLFMIFFIGLIIYVFSRPKKYYQEEENAPLSDDNEDYDNFSNK
jgi:cbb3-type cytochrome oxidase subunit 3